MTGAVRRTHKAVWPRPFALLDKIDVDGRPWVVVHCTRLEVARWVRANKQTLWYEHPSGAPLIFDMDARLYDMMAMTFAK